MPDSCHFQGCKLALLRIVKRRYIKYHVFAFFCAHAGSTESFEGTLGPLPSTWDGSLVEALKTRYSSTYVIKPNVVTPGNTIWT